MSEQEMEKEVPPGDAPGKQEEAPPVDLKELELRLQVTEKMAQKSRRDVIALEKVVHALLAKNPEIAYAMDQGRDLGRFDERRQQLHVNHVDRASHGRVHRALHALRTYRVERDGFDHSTEDPYDPDEEPEPEVVNDPTQEPPFPEESDSSGERDS